MEDGKNRREHLVKIIRAFVFFLVMVLPVSLSGSNDSTSMFTDKVKHGTKSVAAFFSRAFVKAILEPEVDSIGVIRDRDTFNLPYNLVLLDKSHDLAVIYFHVVPEVDGDTSLIHNLKGKFKVIFLETGSSWENTGEDSGGNTFTLLTELSPGINTLIIDGGGVFKPSDYFHIRILPDKLSELANTNLYWRDFYIRKSLLHPRFRFLKTITVPETLTFQVLVIDTIKFKWQPLYGKCYPADRILEPSFVDTSETVSKFSLRGRVCAKSETVKDSVLYVTFKIVSGKIESNEFTFPVPYQPICGKLVYDLKIQYLFNMPETGKEFTYRIPVTTDKGYTSVISGMPVRIKLELTSAGTWKRPFIVKDTVFYQTDTLMLKFKCGKKIKTVPFIVNVQKTMDIDQLDIPLNQGRTVKIDVPDGETFTIRSTLRSVVKVDGNTYVLEKGHREKVELGPGTHLITIYKTGR